MAIFEHDAPGNTTGGEARGGRSIHGYGEHFRDVNYPRSNNESKMSEKHMSACFPSPMV